jgi:flagellar basal-body rod modification protein FlgD
METTAIGGASQALTGAAARGLGSLKSEDFFKILVTEMRQQDPFEPTKTSDMINQVSQIRGIELNGQLTDTLSNMARSQRTAGASELLGRFVTALVPQGDGGVAELRGLVTGVRFNPDGAAVLELDNGDAVLASQVTRVTASETAASQQSSAPPSTAVPASPTDAVKTGTAKLKLPWLEGVFKL